MHESKLIRQVSFQPAFSGGVTCHRWVDTVAAGHHSRHSACDRMQRTQLRNPGIGLQPQFLLGASSDSPSKGGRIVSQWNRIHIKLFVATLASKADPPSTPRVKYLLK